MCFLLRLIAAVFVFSALATAAAAQTVVTVCGTDVASGGANLNSALAVGGDIVIRCPGPDEIRFTKEHVLTAPTTIDGEDNATLLGQGSGAMFRVADGGQLVLRRLSVGNPPGNPADDTIFTGIVNSPGAKVELISIETADTRIPYIVETLACQDCSFTRNGNRKLANVAVVLTNQLSFTRASFTGNLARPFAPKNPDKKPQAWIVDSTFAQNEAPGLWIGGTILIRNTRFTANGSGAGYPNHPFGELYGGQAFVEGGRSMAGALDLIGATAEIDDVSFASNRGELGGAISAIGSRLIVRRSDFQDNSATLGGGAILHFATEKLEPVLSWESQSLLLKHTKFRRNKSEKDGGAVLFRGSLTGDALLFRLNVAGERGGAVSVAGDDIKPGGLDASTIDKTRRSALALSRSFLLDNSAKGGAAVEGSWARVQLGDVVIARNSAGTGLGDGSLHGSSLEVVNSTVIGNTGAGIAIALASTAPAAPDPAGLTLSNAIIANNNAGNCTGDLGGIKLVGPNLQFPGTDCGNAILVAEPSLNARFAPQAWSPARSSGDTAVCASHPLIEGRDIYGEPRPYASACALGAAEMSVMRDVVRELPLGLGQGDNWRCLILVLLLLLLFAMVVGVFLGLRRRRRRQSTR